MLLVVLIFSPKKYISFDESHVSNSIDFLLIGFALLIITSNFTALQLQGVNLIISETVVFFLPGWFILRLVKLDKKMDSWLAKLILSFVFSIGVSSLVFSMGILTHTSSNGVLISTFYLGYSVIIKFILYRKQTRDRPIVSKTSTRKLNLVNLLLLTWILIFFIFIVSMLYPKLADVPGSDIVRHLSSSNELLQSPQLYVSDYPWFHFPIALTKILSDAPDWMMQIGLSYLSLILIISFYIMARRYLFEIDSRAAILSTVFFSVFAGFGWLYFLLHTNDITNLENYLNSFSSTNSATYWDVGFGGSTWLWFWFRPLTVGFSVLFTCLYLLRSYELPMPLLVGVMAFLVLVLSQTHVTELVMFVGIVSTSCLFIPSMRLRLKETSIGILIGLVTSVLVSNAIPIVLNSSYQTPQNSTLLGLIGATIGSLVLLKLPRKKFRFPAVNTFFVCAAAVFIYLVLLLSWLNTVDNNSLRKVAAVLAVPWEFYPVLLGVVGLLAIPSIIIVLKKYRNHPVMIFLILFFIAIIFGRIVTYFNLEIGGLGYWERRTVPFVLASVSILSTLFFLYFTRLPLFKSKTATNLARVAIISCLVLFGTFSTLLSAQFQYNSVFVNGITNNERKLQDTLKGVGHDYTVLTANTRANNLVEYYNPGYLIGYYKVQIWPSKSPELPLQVLSILGNKSSIFLNSGDSMRINRGGFAYHLVGMGQSADPTHEGLITLPRMVPPVSHSNLALVLPDEPSKYEYYAYDLLSISGLNYTTTKLSDITQLNKSSSLVAPTEGIGAELKVLKDRYNLKFHDLIILNLDGNTKLTRKGEIISNLIKQNGSHWLTEGINKGSISAPSLTINSTELEGESLSIKVANGPFALWQIYQKFEPQINLSNYDLFNFMWFGKNDGKFYVIEFVTPSGDSFWYRFKDTWIGWNQVSIPLHQQNGRFIIFGVTMDVVAGKNASWNKVTRINIRTEASNLNNSGNFYLKGLSLQSKLQSNGIDFTSSGIENKFPENIDLYPITTTGFSNVKAIYNNTAVPFLMEENNTNLNISYLNIYPIIKKIETDPVFAKIMYPELGNIFPFKLPMYQSPTKDIRALVKGGVSAFRSLNGSGYITAYSTSASITPISPIVKLTVDGKESNLAGIDRILPVTENYSILKAKNIVTKGGYGFYLSGISNSSSISYLGNPARILLLTNGSGQIFSGNNLTVTLPISAFVLRQPTIKIIGTALIDDFYAYGDLNSKLQSLGNDIKVGGTLNFVTQIADEFSVNRNTSIIGQIVRYPSLYYYDDLNNLSKLFNFYSFRHIIAIFVILVLVSIIFNGKRFRKPEALPSNA